ncbi:hypothetical protein D9M69_280950 [compost metagenome]
MVGLGGVGEVGGLHQGAPGRAGFRAQFVEENLPRTLMEEGPVVGGIGRRRAETAVEGQQALQAFLGPRPFGRRQGVDGLLQGRGHARVLQHALELGREGAGLVVLHGDHALPVVPGAAAGQFRDALGALGVVPGVGQLHAVAALHGAVVGGAEPALRRVLVIGVEHGVGVAIPVVAAVPAGGWQQAAAFAAVRIAAGDLPGDVPGIGVEDVQAHGADFAGGLVGLLHGLGAGQGEEGVQRLVRFELAGLQREAVAALDLHRLQRMLALAQHRVQQRSVTGLVDHFAHRALALDEEGFHALAGRHPLAVGLVIEAAAFAPDLLQEEVLVVAHDHGHAPGQLAVVTGDHGRNAGNGDPGGLEFRRADLHEVPRRGHGDRQVRVVGQDAAAATALLRGDGPVVGGGDAEHVQRGDLPGRLVQCGQPRNLAAELQTLELFGFLEG